MKENGKKSKMTYSGGEKYYGEMQGFVRHGLGTYTWQNGVKYTGNWFDGEMQGKGTLIYDSGTKYVGMFKDGFEHGEGVLTAPDGFKYEGEFVEGRPIGAEALTESQKLLNPDPRSSSKPDPEAEEWAERNVWFGNDEIMTLASFAIHRKIVDEGVKPSSDEYFQELDKRMRSEFPKKFSEGKYIGDESKKQLH